MPVIDKQPINPNTDITTTRTLLHEAIPLTGAIASGTYREGDNATNIKNYAHGMFQSVYDYPYLSSSANHIFDITMGFDESSELSGGFGAVQQEKKINMYNQMSQQLLGYTGSQNKVRLFESDLKLDELGKMDACFFFNFSRLISKDQIKKGTFRMNFGSGSWAHPWGTGSTVPAGAPETIFGSGFVVGDASASADDSHTTNTVGGDYGVLYMRKGTNVDSSTSTWYTDPQGWGDGSSQGVGVIFYQAGIAVLTCSIFQQGEARGEFYRELGASMDTPYGVTGSFVSASMSGTCDAIRHRLYNVSFNNTTEINSTIYFCRVRHNEFNYSSNPTYVTGSKIRVKNIASDDPVSYITTVGLYNANNELLAVAKLSEPLRKDPSNELTLRVRLDY
jgi:hypothetical protein